MGNDVLSMILIEYIRHLCQLIDLLFLELRLSCKSALSPTGPPLMTQYCIAVATYAKDNTTNTVHVRCVELTLPSATPSSLVHTTTTTTIKDTPQIPCKSSPEVSSIYNTPTPTPAQDTTNRQKAKQRPPC